MTSTPPPHLRSDRHAASPQPVPGARDVTTVRPDPGVVRGFRTPVRGHAFAARPPGGAAVLGTRGAAVRLVREDDNPADGLAVAVWVTGPAPWRIGYLDRVVAARIAPLLDAGHRVEAQLAGTVTSPGGWDRPLVTVTGPRAGHEGAGCPERSGRLWGRPPGVERRTVPAR